MKKPCHPKPPKKRKHRYEVYVGNIGCVHFGHVRCEAVNDFKHYVEQSATGSGRAALEEVTLFRDGEPIRTYQPCSPGAPEDL